MDTVQLQQQQQHQHQHQYQQQQRMAKSKSLPKIETQTLAGEQSSIQEEVTQLKSVITKTIENNNENVKEVEEELEKIANERKAATERVILTDAFDTRSSQANSNTHNTDFEPIVETFSEDDAIVIKPKQSIDEQRRQAVAAETSENDYVIEDNTIKNHGGKLATVDIDNEQQQINQKSIGLAAITNRPNEPIAFTSNEFDGRNGAANHNNHGNPNSNRNSDMNNSNNNGFDDVTIGLETPKVRPSSLIHPRTQFWVAILFTILFFTLRMHRKKNVHTHIHAHAPYTHTPIRFCSLQFSSLHLIFVQLLFHVKNFV